MKKMALLILLAPILAIASPQGVPNQFEVTITQAGVSTVAAPVNLNRGYLIMQNKGSSTCQIGIGTGLKNLGQDGLFIATLQNYEMQQAFMKSSVFLMCGSVPTTFTFVETNF